MLPLDPGSGTVEAQTSSALLVSERLSDTDIANAIAHVIRDVPGVLDMGQGVFARAATYRPGKHIVGIVFQHRAPGVLSVEVHVVLDETTLLKALSDIASNSDHPSILLRCTDHIRAVVSQTVEHLGLPVPTMVDVIIDDMR